MLFVLIAVLAFLFLMAVGGIIGAAAAGAVVVAIGLVLAAFLIAILLISAIAHLIWRLLDPERAKAEWEGRSTMGAIRLPGETREQAEKRLAERQAAFRAMRGG